MIDAIEGVDHRAGLVLAQQTVVHEQAVQPVADRPVDQKRGHGRIHPAAQPRHDAPAPDLLADRGDRLLDERMHPPAPLASADVVEEVAQHRPAVLRMGDLRVELDGMKAPAVVGHRGTGGVRAGRRPLEAPRQFDDLVPVAHPDLLHGRLSGEQSRGAEDPQLRRAELALRRPDHPPAELLSHELHAVTDPEHRQPLPVH